MSRKAASWVLLASIVGCVREYHPEFHPETSYSYVQNIVTVMPAPPPVVVMPPPAMVASVSPVSRAFAEDILGGPLSDRQHPGGATKRPTHVVVRAKAPVREVQYAPVFLADDARP